MAEFISTTTPRLVVKVDRKLQQTPLQPRAQRWRAQPYYHPCRWPFSLPFCNTLDWHKQLRHFAIVLAMLVTLHALIPQSAPVSAQGTIGPRTTSTIQRIRNRGNTLIVGVSYDYAPFGYLDAAGAVTGFEPDLVRALAAQWGVAVTFVPVTPAARLQNLLAGQVDLLVAALPHTPENEALIDFGPHYFVDTTGLLLNADSQTINLSALVGKTIATVQDAHAQARLDEYLAGLGVTGTTILPFQEHAPALRALQAGQADALLADQVYLTTVAREQASFSVIVPVADEHAFGFGLMPGDSYFRNLLEVTFQQLYTSGIYAELYRKWFPDRTVPDWPTRPGTWPYRSDTLPAAMGSAATNATPTNATLTNDESTANDQSQLDRLRNRRMLLAGVRYDMPPFGFLDATGAVQGFEVDLLHEFARRWFGDADALELVRVTPDTAIPLLNAGQVDLVAAALAHNWSNEALIDFSLDYYADTLGVLVRADSEVDGVDGLNGELVATVNGANASEDISALMGAAALAESLPFRRVPYC
ncbi:MAG: transporter substrate-binding domain-containing protein [Caldilineaceae bacterium]